MLECKLHLRSATADDVERVKDILTSSRLEYLPYAKSPHSTDEIHRWVSGTLIPSGGVVIAQLHSEDVGVLATSESEGVGWIDQLYIVPGHVRQGVGTALLNHAKSFLPQPIRLWTFQENHRAIRFYECHGFKAIKHTTGKYNEEKCPDILFEHNPLPTW